MTTEQYNPHLRGMADPFDEASRRVEIAKKVNAPELKLTIQGLEKLPDLSALSALKSLDLRGTNISDITTISSLYGLRTLNLARTKVSDISPLSNLTAIRELNLIGTMVSNLEPLSGLSSLRLLRIDEIDAKNLLPLALLTTLVDGAISDHRYGLTYRGLIPHYDYNDHDSEIIFGRAKDYWRKVKQLSELKNPESTIQIINYLREQQGLTPYFPADDAEDIAALSAERLEKLLEQNGAGTRVVASGEQLALAASGNDSDISATQSPVAQYLHRSLGPKLRSLADFAVRVQNQPGWHDLFEDAKALHQLAERSLPEIAECVAEFWSLSGAMGAFLAQDDDAKRPDSMISPLEPDGRRYLSEVVTLAATLTRQFPTAVKLDRELREALHKPEPVEPAKATIEVVRETQILRADHVTILRASLNAPVQNDPQSRKAHDRSVRTTRNVIFAALIAGGGFLSAGLGEGYLNEIGGDIARRGILAKRVEDFIIKGEKSIADLLEGEPADKQAAAREMVRRIKQGSHQPPPKPEPPPSK